MRFPNEQIHGDQVEPCQSSQPLHIQSWLQQEMQYFQHLSSWNCHVLHMPVIIISASLSKGLMPQKITIFFHNETKHDATLTCHMTTTAFISKQWALNLLSSWKRSSMLIVWQNFQPWLRDMRDYVSHRLQIRGPCRQYVHLFLYGV